MYFMKLGGILVNLARVTDIRFNTDEDGGFLILTMVNGNAITIPAEQADFDELCDDIEKLSGGDFE